MFGVMDPEAEGQDPAGAHRFALCALLSSCSNRIKFELRGGPGDRAHRPDGVRQCIPAKIHDRAKRATLEELEEILPGLRCLIDASEQQGAQTSP